MTEKDGKLERRKSSASSGKSPKKSSKPPSTHENRGLSKLAIPRPKKDDPSHFGIPTTTSRAPPVVSQMTAPIPLRPRAVTAQTYPARPLSYHAAYTSGGYATGPPLSNSAWFHQQYTIPPPSYPPPSPSYFRYSMTPQAGADYFNPPASTTPISARPLHERFDSVETSNYDPIPRTSSAYGSRDTVPQQVLDSVYDDGYMSHSEGPVRRRVSVSRPSIRTKQEVDYESMPPPPRPGILRRPTTVYYETPDPPSRRDSRSIYRDDPPPVRRPSLRRNSVTYDVPDSGRVHVFETANAGRRRKSYYGPSTESTGSSDYVSDKVRQAQTYQEEVTGPPPVPLTADLLKRQQRRQAGSSRSTKSSGSRDESDYRKSATTRTTRSGSNEDGENVTIKVTGTARVMVGGTQIDCADGGEIEIKRQKSIRNGSERGSNSEYGGTQRDRLEDRRSRIDRPTGRLRMSSQSNQSYTRTTPQWI